MGKEQNKLHKAKRYLAFLLTICTAFTAIPTDLLAQDKTSDIVDELEDEGVSALSEGQPEILIKVNGGESQPVKMNVEKDFNTAVQVSYGDSYELLLDQEELNAISPNKFIYINRSDVKNESNPSASSNIWQRSEDASQYPKEPGEYYIGYDFEDAYGTTIGLNNFGYGIRITTAVPKAPEGLSWTNGSTASWSPVTSKTSGSQLGEGIIDHYLVKIYKDGSEAGSVEVEPSATSYDFTDFMLQDAKGGEGVYTFTVQAIVIQAEKDNNHYADSDTASTVGTAAGSAHVVRINVEADTGVGNVKAVAGGQTFQEEPVSVLLIAKNSEHNSVSLHAENLKANREFAGWEWNTENVKVSIENSEQENATITLPDTYLNLALTLTVQACTTDTGAPVIESYYAGKDTEEESYGTLYGKASDAESGIAAYAFSKEKDAASVTEWQKVEGSEAGKVEAISWTPDESVSPGQYYLYVKDSAGNITRNDQAIPVAIVTYQDYYKEGAPSLYQQVLVGDERRNLPETSRFGYTFDGWYQKSNYQEASKLEQISAKDCSTTDTKILYAKWIQDLVKFTAPIEDYEGEYDGAEHEITATLDEKYTHVTYQWYKITTERAEDGEPVEGATSATLSVKDVSDSGTYYLKAEVALGNGDFTIAKSDEVVVNITKKQLLIEVTDQTVAFGDEPAEFVYSYSGFAGDEDENTPGFVEGEIYCDYDKNASELVAGRAFAVQTRGFEAENYEITVTGYVDVTQKDVNAEGASITAALANEETTFVYNGSPFEPDIVVKNGDSVVDAGNYELTYGNHTNAGTATVTVTFKKNYTGTLATTFEIEKATYSASVIQKGWEYGDEGSRTEPGISNVMEDATPVFYYQKKDSAEVTTERPTAVGTYQIYAVISETANYQSITTDRVEFTIEPRKITLKSANASWIYDGNKHLNTNYTMEGNFVGTDSFLNVVVNGNITDVGSTENTISYTLSSSTKSENYAITLEPGTLKITPRSLTAPSSFQWSQTKPGTAEWIAVTKTGLEVSYQVSLYHTSDPTTEIAEVETADTSYDFSSVMKADTAKEGKPEGYFFKVKAKPTGGTNLSNYGDSEKTAASPKIYSVMIKVDKTSGIASAGINGSNTTAIMLQGESAPIKTMIHEGYMFPEIIWTANGDDTSGIGFEDAGKAATNIKISNTLAGPATVTIRANSNDEEPCIESFSATGIGESPYINQQVQFTIEASDTKELKAWAITTSKTQLDELSDEWQELEPGTSNITKTIQVNAADLDKDMTYFAWVMDDNNNIVCAEESITLYPIQFAGGDGTGSMPNLLKIQNKTLKLPENAFTNIGYVFQNWKGVTGIYANRGNYTNNKSDVLTAQWTNQQISYTVNYFYMDTEGNYKDTPDQSRNFSGAFGTSIQTDTPGIQTNQTGMARDETKNDTIILNKEGQSLSIYYKRSSYTITYSYTIPGESQTNVVHTYRYGETFNELERPSAEGYSFVGWIYGESGTTPETMPSKNITATGTFLANDATYEINYYVENLKDNPSDRTSYSLVSDMTEMKTGIHDSYVATSTKDAETIEGFQVKGALISTGAAGGAYINEADLTETVRGKISVKENEKLHINYYFTRDSYSITLNVWKANRTSDSNQMYTHTWSDVKYGTNLDYHFYETYDQDNWETQDVNGYKLADYVDWSTGTPPEKMPAGNITLSRDYVSTTISSYQVEAYFENVDGTFSRGTALTYYGSVGSKVKVGTDADTDTITISNLQSTVPGVSDYDFDPSQGLIEGTVTEVTEKNPIPLTLKVYFTRKEVKTVIRYYYNKYDEENGTSKQILMGTIEKNGKWGTEYSFDLTMLFAGDTDLSALTDAGYVSKNETIDGISAEKYDFKKNEYVINYSGLYLEGGHNQYFGHQITTIKDMEVKTAKFGNDQDKNYVNIYYSMPNIGDHYYLSMYCTPERLDAIKKSIPPFPLKEEIGGKTYYLRVANKADVFEADYVKDTSIDYSKYPGLSYVNGNYEYKKKDITSEDESDANLVLRDGFEPIEVTYEDKGVDCTATYYTQVEDGVNYIYLIDEKNQFYKGNTASYNYYKFELNPAKLGYQSVVDFLDDYKTNDKYSSDSSRQGAYIYEQSYYSTMYGNSNYELFFRYADTYNVDYSLSGEHLYNMRYAKGTNVPLADGVSTPSQKGYTVCWYLDGSYTKPAPEMLTIKDHMMIYGRYERQMVSYHEYAYYQVADSLHTVDGSVQYVTENNLEAVKEAVGYQEASSKDEAVRQSISGKDGGPLLTSFSEEKTVDFTNEFGKVSEQKETIISYYYDGILVMLDNIKPGMTFSQVVMNYSKTGYLRDGFHYDDTNSNNSVKGYCQIDPVNLSVYFARDKYTLTIYRNTSGLKVPDTMTYKFGQKIELNDMVRNGYEFTDWVWEYSQDKDADGNEIWNGMDPSEISDCILAQDSITGDLSFRMPSKRIQLTAEWNPTTFDQEITHYFQETTKTYSTELMAELRTCTDDRKVSANLMQNGESKEGTLYYKDAEKTNLLGASVPTEINGVSYTFYYSYASLKNDKWEVNTLNLIAATNKVNHISETPVELGSHLFESDQFSMFSFAFVVYLSQTKVETYYNSTDEYVYDYNSTVDYYYTRSSNYTIRETVKATDGGEAGTTLIGAGSYQYGENIAMKANLSSGYRFVGWYRAKDVLEGYPENINEADMSDLNLNEMPLKDGWDKKEPVNINSIANVDVTESMDYVAVVEPLEVAVPSSVEIYSYSGKYECEYGYKPNSDDALTLKIEFPEGTSAENYISGYQWYYSTSPVGPRYAIEGENTFSYLFPEGQESGTYYVSCEITISRKDNGRTVSYLPERGSTGECKIVVKTLGMDVRGKDYKGVYDGKGHSISVDVKDPIDTSKYEIYYSETPLTKDNYTDESISSKTKPEFTDVAVEGEGEAEYQSAYRVYYYVHSLDKDYSDVSGSSYVIITPATLTLTSKNAFKKTYDATNGVQGELVETGSQKQSLSYGNGNYYTVNGIKERDASMQVILDFAAEFNSNHVDTANILTMSAFKLVKVTGEGDDKVVKRNWNYTFANDYSLIIPASIDAYRMRTVWSEETSFIYDGEEHGPAVYLEDDEALPDDLVEGEITGKQSNAGTYTAYVNVVELENVVGDSYHSSDYYIENNTCRFTIEKRPVEITPVDAAYTYDGKAHTLTEFTTGEGQIVEGQTFEASALPMQKNAGSYTISASNMRIYQDMKEVTDNYAITYRSGTLTIDRKKVTFSGVLATDKTYDKTTDVELDLTNVVFQTAGQGVDAPANGKETGDELFLDAAKIEGAFEDENVGTDKKVTLTYGADVLSGVSASNYELVIHEVIDGETFNSQSEATASIYKKKVYVTPNTTAVIYGEDAAFSSTYRGFMGDAMGDATDEMAKEFLNSSSGEIRYKIKSNTVGASEVPYYAAPIGEHIATQAGQYEIVIDVSTLSADNYEFVDGSKLEGSTPSSLTVEKRKIAVSAKSDARLTKIYDGTTTAKNLVQKAADNDVADNAPDSGVCYEFVTVPDMEKTGIVNHDAVSLTEFSASYNSKDVDTADKITVSEMSIDNQNYELSHSTFDITANITQRDLTITAEDKNITYGEAAPDYTAVYTGLQAGDQAKDLGTISYTCAYENVAGSANRVVKNYTISIDEASVKTGALSTNYNITLVNGTLKVKKAVIQVIAEDKNVTYGITDMPDYSCKYKGFQYGESETDEAVVTGIDKVRYTCKEGTRLEDAEETAIEKEADKEVSGTTKAGTYRITPIIADEDGNCVLLSNNYEFEAVQGNFLIELKEIKVSGVVVDEKTYDGTTDVKQSNIKTNAAVYEGINEADVSQKGIVVTAEYEDPNVGTGKKVTLHIQLNDYLKSRYLLKSTTQTTTTASITKKKLTVKARNQEISYGSAAPEFDVSYSGFVGEESKEDLKGTLSVTTNYHTNDGVGTYVVTPAGYSEDNNYTFVYETGVLTVKKAKLETSSAAVWDTETPGTITWGEVPGIGTVSVEKYQIDLYQYQHDTATAELKSTYYLSEADAERSGCRYNLLEEIRALGAGQYHVKITAISSDTANVENSDARMSNSIFATNVTVAYAEDDVTTEGKNKIGIHGSETPSYVVVAGEKNVTLSASLVNATGYQAEQWVRMQDTTVITDNKSEITELKQEAGNVSAKFGVSNKLDNSNTITLVLSLKKTPATIDAKMTVEKRNGEWPFYDYGDGSDGKEDTRPILTVTASPVTEGDSKDNVGADGYTYTYEWGVRKGTVGAFTRIETEATSNSCYFPLNFNAAENYVVQCIVTATRKDNGETVTTDDDENPSQIITVQKAVFRSSVVLSGWTYGTKRSEPRVTNNPENTQVTYYYSTSKEESADWTTDIPTDAGTYYIKAFIKEGVNYGAYTTDPVQFEIQKAKLEVPKNLKMGPTETVPYGRAIWTPVKAPVENDGTEGDSASSTQIEYHVTLYYSEELDESADGNKVTNVLKTYITTEPSCDMLAEINKEGSYRFTVQAVVVGENQKNCEDGNVSAKDGALNISATISSDAVDFTKVYDGTPMTLTVHSSIKEGVEYQWCLNNTEIEGANEETYQLSTVDQSGVYSCRITVIENGRQFESLNEAVTIQKREITLFTAGETRDYDGTALTRNQLETEGEHNADWWLSPDTSLGTGDAVTLKLENSVTDVGDILNAVSELVIEHTQIIDGKKVVTKVYGEEAGDPANYVVTKEEGTLKVEPKSLGNESDFVEGIEYSLSLKGNPLGGEHTVTYNGKVFEPATTVRDSKIGASGTTLVMNKDYTVSYVNNLHAGRTGAPEAVVTVTGIGNYKDSITQTFVIEKRAITLTSESIEKVPYHKGNTVKSEGVGALSVTSSTQLAEGDSLTAVTFTKQLTEVELCNNEFEGVEIRNALNEVLTAEEGTGYSDYLITKEYGTLEVVQTEDTIAINRTTEELSKTYDSIPFAGLEDSDYSREGTGVITTVYYEKKNGRYVKMDDVPVNAGAYAIQLEAEQDRNYKAAKSNTVDFSIAKRPVTIEAANKSSQYLEALQSLTYEVQISDEEGDSFTTETKAAFIERIKSDLDILLSTTATATSVVGKYPITIDYTEHDNYDVTLNEVDLTTATKCNAVYTIANATMIYQVTAEDGIYDKKGHSINIAVTTPPTGTVIYYSTNADLASGKKDDPSAVEGASNEKPAFTAAGIHTVYYYITAPNYEDVYGWKTVTIQKAEQTITAEDSQFITYDGKTHVPHAVADGGGTLSYSCKDAAGKAVSEMIDAGTYTVTIHAAETGNYNTATSITRTFTIKAAGLTIQASSKTAEYAEDARLTCQEYTMKSGSLADGDTITDVIMRSYQQNVGACDNIIEGVVIRSERRENVDVTKNYSITYEKGTLTVTQATPVIEFTTTSVDMNKTYNKVPVEDPVFTKTGDGTASIQYYRIEKSGETESRTLLTTRPVNAGDYEAEVTTTATHNYKVGTSTPLRFKIEPQPVKITGQPQKSKYGETIKEVTAKLTGGTVYEGDNLYVSAATTATRTSAVGTYAVIPGYKADPNYKVTTENGVYTIENAAIQYEITGTDVTFDTTAHKIKIETTEPVKADIYYSETSFAGVREEDLTEEQKKVPEHTNAGEYTIYYYIKAPNYESVISSVSMKIGKAKQDISVEEASCTYSYDGKPHMIEASASDGGEISYRVEGVASSDHIIDAGTYHVTVTANATSNYAIATKKVDMTINRLPITITADSKEREYDRTDLTKNSYRMTSGSLADGDSIEAVVVTGSQNEVGSSPNIAKDALIRSSKRPTGESDVTKNYTISYVPGTLKVTKAEPAVQITSTPDQLGKTYNKTNIITPIVTSTGDSTPVIYYYKVEGENETRLADGEIPVNAGIYKVKAYAKETKNFKESYSDAVTFEITPEEIELRAHDATSIYGKEIEVLETSITKGKIYSGDSLGIKAVTDAEKGSNAGTYDIIPTYTVNPNYDVKVFKGTYTITKAEMVCSIEGETVDYDGSGHSIQIEMTAPSVVNAEIYYSTKEELTEDNYRDKDIATTIRPHFTSVGSHVVYYYIVAPNYLAKAGHETVKIRKAG